jgi:hypothetical protein
MTSVVRTTALHKNPFWVLGVSLRDDRHKIVSTAEEMSLQIDPELCQKARADLINPRTRLSAEVSWLPGVSPGRAADLMKMLDEAPLNVRDEAGLPTLARANLMAAVIHDIGPQGQISRLADFIHQLALVVANLESDDVLRDVNEERTVSGFPEVKDVSLVEAELEERKRAWRTEITDALNRMPYQARVAALTKVVDAGTGRGKRHAPELIDELVDSYQIELQGVMETEGENIDRLVQAVREAARPSGGNLDEMFEDLERAARAWDRAAQPIQVSTKARGLEHTPSHQIAWKIRRLGVHLFNDHNMVAQAQRITALLQELFAEVPEVTDALEQDVHAIKGIIENKRKAEADQRKWEEELTYEADLGLVFKDKLRISPQGVAFKDKSYPLEKITRVRWGGVKNSVNGIPTGTNYTIAFGDWESEAVVQLTKQDVYSAFIDRLHKAVGVKIMTEMLTNLRNNMQYTMGEAVVTDTHVTLVKRKFLKTEKVMKAWREVQIWNADGSFFIGDPTDKHTYASMPYIQTSNVHLLEQIVRACFEKGLTDRLSDLLA